MNSFYRWEEDVPVLNILGTPGARGERQYRRLH
jgi:hypothetical protein